MYRGVQEGPPKLRGMCLSDDLLEISSGPVRSGPPFEYTSAGRSAAKFSQLEATHCTNCGVAYNLQSSFNLNNNFIKI